jgi:putative toxin-antitoxin system antitoxin component (TIGR02293 family)
MTIESLLNDLDADLPQKLAATLALTPAQLEEHLLSGMPPSAVRALAERGFTVAELDWIIFPHKAAQRAAAGMPLTRDETLRLVRLARVYCLATSAFGSETAAFNWLRQPQSTYGGLTPLEVCKSPRGAHHVEELLDREDQREES